MLRNLQAQTALVTSSRVGSLTQCYKDTFLPFIILMSTFVDCFSSIEVDRID